MCVRLAALSTSPGLLVVVGAVLVVCAVSPCVRVSPAPPSICGNQDLGANGDNQTQRKIRFLWHSHKTTLQLKSPSPFPQMRVVNTASDCSLSKSCRDHEWSQLSNVIGSDRGVHRCAFTLCAITPGCAIAVTCGSRPLQQQQLPLAHQRRWRTSVTTAATLAAAERWTSCAVRPPH